MMMIKDHVYDDGAQEVGQWVILNWLLTFYYIAWTPESPMQGVEKGRLFLKCLCSVRVCRCAYVCNSLYTCMRVFVCVKIFLCSFVCVFVWLFVWGLRHCRLSGVDENPPRTCLQFSEIDSDELLPQRFTRQPLSLIIILVFRLHLSSGHHYLFEQGNSLKRSCLHPDTNQQRKLAKNESQQI